MDSSANTNNSRGFYASYIAQNEITFTKVCREPAFDIPTYTRRVRQLQQKPILKKVTQLTQNNSNLVGKPLNFIPERLGTVCQPIKTRKHVTNRLIPTFWFDVLGSVDLMAESAECISDLEISEKVQKNIYLMAKSIRSGDELIVLLHKLGIITSEEKRIIKDLPSELQQTVSALSKAVFKREKNTQKLLQILLFVGNQEIVEKMEETLRAF